MTCIGYRAALLGLMALVLGCEGPERWESTRSPLQTTEPGTDGVSFLWKFTGEHHVGGNMPGTWTWLSGDVNNDGKDDLIRRYVNGSTHPFNVVMLSNGDGTFQKVYSDEYNGANGDGNYWFLTGDFDGDGKTDLARRHISGNTNALNKIFVSNGDGTFRVVHSDSYVGINGTGRWWWTTGDVNSDGRTDLIRRDLNGTHNVVLLSKLHPNGDPYFEGNVSDSLPRVTGDGAYWYLTGDFNGDGRTDLVRRHVNGVYNKVLLANTDGKTFQIVNAPDSEAGVNDDGEFEWLTGDFNGDGRTDLVRRSRNGKLNRLLLAAQDGRSFTVIESPDLYVGVRSGGKYQWFVADFNGDGKDDLVRREENGPFNAVLLANETGTGFEAHRSGDLLGFAEYKDHAECQTRPAPEISEWLLGDFSGDGLPDLARRSAVGQATVEDPSTQIGARNLVLINNFGHRYDQYFFERSVFEPQLGGFHSFRIPAIVQATSGRLLAFAEGRRNTAYDYDDIDLVLRTSEDGGITWSPLRILGTTNPARASDAQWLIHGDDPEGVVGNPTPVVDRNTGTIWLFFIHTADEHHSGKYCGEACGQTLDPSCEATWTPGARKIYVTSSTNHGETWSPPVLQAHLMMDGKDGRKTFLFDNIGPGNGIQTTDGTMLVIPARERNIFSTDGGVTWTYAMTDPGTSSEFAIAETNGGFYRNDRACSTCPKQRVVARLNADLSMQNAWQPEPQLPDPISQASIVRFPVPDAQANALLFLNPGTPQNRQQMVASISYDDGVTWARKRPLDYRKGGYSSMTMCGEYICSLQEWNNAGGVFVPRRIVFRRFNFAWLNDGPLTLHQ